MLTAVRVDLPLGAAEQFRAAERAPFEGTLHPLCETPGAFTLVGDEAGHQIARLALTAVRRLCHVAKLTPGRKQAVELMVNQRDGLLGGAMAEQDAGL